MKNILLFKDHKIKFKEKLFPFDLNIILIFLGSLLVYFINERSYTYSYLFLTFLSILINPQVFKSKVKIHAFLLLFSILFFYLISFAVFQNHDNSRFFSSFILDFLSIYASLNASKYIIKLPNKKFINTILIIFYILLALSGISLINLYFSSFQDRRILFFAEPSHYALFFIPFLHFFINFSKKNFIRFFLILYLIFFSVTIQNLTLLLAIFLSLFITFKNYFILFIPFLLLFFINSDSFQEYFLDRVFIFSSINTFDSINNLSLLVFLSSYERSYLNFIESFGFGIGFQQLGYNGNYGFFYNRIITIMNGRPLNQFDGGTLASQFISELGFIGLIMSIVYFYFFLKFVFVKVSNEKVNSKYFLFTSFYIFFGLQIFFRGIGYFNPYSFIVLIFLLTPKGLLKYEKT